MSFDGGGAGVAHLYCAYSPGAPDIPCGRIGCDGSGSAADAVVAASRSKAMTADGWWIDGGAGTSRISGRKFLTHRCLMGAGFTHTGEKPRSFFHTNYDPTTIFGSRVSVWKVGRGRTLTAQFTSPILALHSAHGLPQLAWCVVVSPRHTLQCRPLPMPCLGLHPRSPLLAEGQPCCHP